MAFEYKVVPAPVKGTKARGAKTGADRFALALQTIMNDHAGDGWEYQRADTLPCEEREGLMGKTTVFQNMLVFRREKQAAVMQDPVVLAKALPAPEPEPEPVIAQPAPPESTASGETQPPRVAAE